jgi:Uma2 family endonuclease
MSTPTTTKRMTADEFADWVLRPENEARHYELYRGEVEEVSRPGERHGVVCANVVGKLHHYKQQTKRGYVLCNDPGVILERDPDTVRGPDVAYFPKRKRYEDMNPKFIEDPPALVVEVLFPNDRIGKVTRRVAEFLRAGVRLVWLLDPEACDVTVYPAGKPSYVVEPKGEITGDDVLEGFRCAIAEFFANGEEEQSPAASDASPPSS